MIANVPSVGLLRRTGARFLSFASGAIRPFFGPDLVLRKLDFRQRVARVCRRE